MKLLSAGVADSNKTKLLRGLHGLVSSKKIDFKTIRAFLFDGVIEGESQTTKQSLGIKKSGFQSYEELMLSYALLNLDSLEGWKVESHEPTAVAEIVSNVSVGLTSLWNMVSPTKPSSSLNTLIASVQPDEMDGLSYLCFKWKGVLSADNEIRIISEGDRAGEVCLYEVAAGDKSGKKQRKEFFREEDVETFKLDFLKGGDRKHDSIIGSHKAKVEEVLQSATVSDSGIFEGEEWDREADLILRQLTSHYQLAGDGNMTAEDEYRLNVISGRNISQKISPRISGGSGDSSEEEEDWTDIVFSTSPSLSNDPTLIQTLIACGDIGDIKNYIASGLELKGALEEVVTHLKLIETYPAEKKYKEIANAIVIAAATEQRAEGAWKEIIEGNSPTIMDPDLLKNLDSTTRKFLGVILPPEVVRGLSASDFKSAFEIETSEAERLRGEVFGNADLQWDDKIILNQRLLETLKTPAISSSTPLLDQASSLDKQEQETNEVWDDYDEEVEFSVDEEVVIDSRSGPFPPVISRGFYKTVDVSEDEIRIFEDNPVIEKVLQDLSAGKTVNRYLEALRRTLIGNKSKVSSGVEFFYDEEESYVGISEDLYGLRIKVNQSDKLLSLNIIEVIPSDDLEEDTTIINEIIPGDAEYTQKFAHFLGMEQQYVDNLKLLEWEVQTPSSSPQLVTAEKIAETTLYNPLSIHEESIWKKPSDRGNKLKVVNGVYGLQGEDAQDGIEQTLIDIIITVAANPSLNMTLDQVLLVIEESRKTGGISNKWLKDQDVYNKKDGLEFVDGVDFATAKKFSKMFQKECDACGILSGRKGGKEVGLRTSFIPKTVTDRIEEEATKNGSGSTLLADQDLKKAKANLENRRSLRGTKTIDSRSA